MQDPSSKELPLFLPHSQISTALNKTGSWRFFHPKYDDKTAPCSVACPLGQDIARIEMLTSWGLLKNAWQLIMMENPFPAVCGRVCYHPCEDACNRGHMDEPIAIHHLERFLGDTAIANARVPECLTTADHHRKVAIAGAGPAGLSAAYFLTRLGYHCEVFEADSEPGGLLRTGIPPYRLSRQVLDQEIQRIRDLGVIIHCENPLTGDQMQKIFEQYDALFVGCGYGRPIRLSIDGGHLAQDGLEFLRRLHLGEKMSFDGKAVVFGGGNTAVDVARCLARLGAAPLIVYRRRREDMPAYEPDVKRALQEGVEIMELASPLRIRPNRSKSLSERDGYTLILQQMKLGQKRIGNRAQVIPDGEKTTSIDAANLFVAIGAVVDDLWHDMAVNETPSLSLSHCKFIEHNIPIIIGGDLAVPTNSVTDAIASGKQAALALHTRFEKGPEAVETTLAACRVGPGPAYSMDAFLGGNRRNRNVHVVNYDEIVSDYFQCAPRMVPAAQDANQSRQSFAEVESTLASDDAKEEAARCFNCGNCNACDYCRLYCPEMAVKVQKGQRSIDLDYCKGCGVCATECPRNAMALEEEIK